jgi:hypothetical protein
MVRAATSQQASRCPSRKRAGEPVAFAGANKRKFSSRRPGAHGADHRQIIFDRDRLVELQTGLAADRPDDFRRGAADDRHAEYDEVADLQPAFETHQHTVGADVDAGAHFLPPVGHDEGQAAIDVATRSDTLVEADIVGLARVNLAHFRGPCWFGHDDPLDC